jgi:hypothetical protein
MLLRRKLLRCKEHGFDRCGSVSGMSSRYIGAAQESVDLCPASMPGERESDDAGGGDTTNSLRCLVVIFGRGYLHR